MAKADLTAQRLRELVKYDPSTGVFTRLLRTRGRKSKSGAAGRTRGDGYVTLRIDGPEYLAHRLAFLFMNGSWPNGDVDHIDGDPSNNRFANLRIVERSVNMQNIRKAHKDTRSGLLGVYSNRPNLWYSMIFAGGKQVYLGLFSSPESAHEAYLEAKRKMHSGCTL